MAHAWVARVQAFYELYVYAHDRAFVFIADVVAVVERVLELRKEVPRRALPGLL